MVIKIGRLLSSFGLSRKRPRATKKPPGGGLPPSFFTVSAVTYRSPGGASFGTFKKDSKVAVRIIGLVP